MTEIRAKDKLFLAIAIPAALLAAYWYGWREEAGRTIAALELRQASLVAEEDFQREKLLAGREAAEAAAELKAEKEIPMPQATMKADPDASPADRERLVLKTFKEAGLTMAGSAAAKVDGGPGGERAGRAGALLAATGTRPDPVHRTYTIDGRYPDVVKTLRKFAEEKMAVIPDNVQMRAAGRNRWTLEIWL